MALSDIKNKAQLDVIFADNVTGQISPADMRIFVASTAPHGGALLGAANASFPVTTSPVIVPWALAPSDTDLITFDDTNNKFTVNDSGLYLVTFRMQGIWGTSDELNYEYYINGVATGKIIRNAGRGPGKVGLLSVTRMPIIINEAAITAGGGTADIDIRVYGATGFTLDLYASQMEIDYDNMTINAVG